MKLTDENISDEELLQCYRRSRRPDDLSRLYRRYVPLVYGVALKYLRDSADAQDVVMALFEELLDKVLRHDIQVFRAWLYVCVRNHCLMIMRKRSENLMMTLDEKVMEFCDDFNLDHIRETEEREAEVRKCMDSLPDRQRLCVRYFYMEELSYKDIEQASGFPLKMVKSFIQNGKRNLRLCLESKAIRN